MFGFYYNAYWTKPKALALFKCKVFEQFRSKTLRHPLMWCATSMDIRIETMAEFHKNGSKSRFYEIARRLPRESTALRLIRQTLLYAGWRIVSRGVGIARKNNFRGKVWNFFSVKGVFHRRLWREVEICKDARIDKPGKCGHTCDFCRGTSAAGYFLKTGWLALGLRV